MWMYAFLGGGVWLWAVGERNKEKEMPPHSFGY